MTKRKYSSLHYVRSILGQVWRHPSNRRSRVRAIGRALRWQAYKRISATPKKLQFFGLDLLCYPDSNSASNVVYFTELYDPDEMRFMIAYLRGGDGYLDIGANIGTYTLLAKSLVGPKGEVVAFEPNGLNARRCRENVEANALENVVVHEAAVAAEVGTVEFVDGWDVSNRIVTKADTGRPTTRVTTVTLDSALGSHNFAMGKIDIEGFEPFAFRGARERLASADPPVWQIEILDHQLEKAGTSRRELPALLEGNGFVPAHFDADSATLTELGWAAVGSGNLLAIHGPTYGSVVSRLRGSGGAHGRD